MYVDALELETVRELVDVTGKRVVEVGCGAGRFTFLYAHDAAYVLGIDPKRDEIHDARRARPTTLADHVKFRAAKTVSRPRRRFDIALLSWSL